MYNGKKTGSKSVGIRELKAGLSRYLRRVKSGETLIVTEHKKEIAAIIPIGLDDREERLLRLARQGLIEWSGKAPAGLAERIKIRGKSVSDAVLEDRR